MKLFYIDVLVASGNTNNPREFRPMRPYGSATPYVWPEDEARRWMESYVLQSGKPDHYRLRAVDDLLGEGQS